MSKTYVCRVRAGALVSAVFAAGLLGLTTAGAGFCTASPQCSGPPPPAAASVVALPGCTNPDCASGTPPAMTGRDVSSAASEVDAVIPVVCPPPNAVPVPVDGPPSC